MDNQEQSQAQQQPPTDNGTWDGIEPMAKFVRVNGVKTPRAITLIIVGLLDTRYEIYDAESNYVFNANERLTMANILRDVAYAEQL